MKRFFFAATPFALIFLLFSGGCATDAPQGRREQTELSTEVYSRAGMFAQVLEFLHANYADADAATRERLFEGAINGMASCLDPYSGYEAPKEFDRNQSQRTGTHAGIGVQCVKENDQPPVIIAVTPDSPAARAGLRPGVRILQIDGGKTEKHSLAQCMEKLRGNVGSSLLLQLAFPDVAAPVTVELKRELIRRPSVPPTTAQLLPGGVGFIRIESFNEHTPQEFDDAFRKLKAEGMTHGLIIDLRNNPGGLVDAARKIVSRFLPESTPLFIVRHRRPPEPQTIRADGNDDEKELKLPLVILVNPYTASAAELFAGALQDHRRATLVGMRSFGKGTLLRVLPLPDGGALRYASGHYLTPNGRVIEQNGLEPDLEVLLPAEKTARLVNEPPAPGDDSQLDAALKLFEPHIENPAAPAMKKNQNTPLRENIPQAVPDASSSSNSPEDAATSTVEQ